MRCEGLTGCKASGERSPSARGLEWGRRVQSPAPCPAPAARHIPPALNEELMQLFIHVSRAIHKPLIISSRILTELVGAQPGQPSALGIKQRDFHIDL